MMNIDFLPDVIAATQQSQGGGFSMSYLIIIGGMMLLSMLVSHTLKRRFHEYSDIPLPMTGREVAERMLRDNGITDVQVISTPGQLTDHYNPMDKTVNLSEPVYHMANVAAAAVAAHECGHAVQHQKAYHWLQLRSKMVPAVSFASQIQQYLMFAFIFGLFYTGSVWMLWAMVISLAVIAGFSLVTLPVEFDASNRALAWMERSGIAGRIEHDRAKNALFWAAMTYVVGALTALAQLGYWLMILLGRRD
ncbi:zinc metallopeptidase [Sulfuriroseicoccus oceanibius]|uniref:Zinc metallopeptidase n=1 Tax=Sulfuriroseicoccus oceanibius TaxID=2707525 RepID=A0A7T7JC20_9BACT|nr:zinc metallopeptidase [Sulfuriroseicoccus oceanibius]QQL44576.1 zinc metallopeptidase [Sulfuriroseicoccus oceanibius]